jgi:hypothetical protein
LKLDNEISQSFIGQTSTILIEKWGKPDKEYTYSEIFGNPKKVHVLLYYKEIDRESAATRTITKTGISLASQKHSIEEIEECRFYINDNGVIFKSNSKVYEKE